MTGSDVAAIAAAPAGQDVRKRWLLLVLALVVGLVAAFAIGSAVKKTSAPPVAPGSLAQSSAASAQHAAITPLTTAGAVPALRAPAKKPKPKTKTPTSSSTSASSSSVASSSVGEFVGGELVGLVGARAELHARRQSAQSGVAVAARHRAAASRTVEAAAAPADRREAPGASADRVAGLLELPEAGGER